MKNRKRMHGRALCTLASLALCLPANPAGAADQLHVSESQGVSVTVYNQNFGLVRDLREVDLAEGINNVRFEDVASQIDPTTVSFSSLTAPNAVTVREQNYQYDLINPQTILMKSIGKTAKFRRFAPNGQVEELTGTLLNASAVSISDSSGNVSTQSQGLVLKTANGVLLNPNGEIELAELPAGLVSKPSLLWKLEVDKAGKHKTEIAYQTQGLNWHCDYVTIASADDSQADLTAWVTLDNNCGSSFKNASLKLLAGDVHKVQPQMQAVYGMARAEAAAAPQFAEKAFAEYHLYTLQGKTDLNNNQTKQMTLFAANAVPTKKLFVFEADRNYGDWMPANADPKKINVKLEIENKQTNHLGIPMPAGKVRVYKRDDDGSLQFVGEDSIDHTARDEKVRIYLGDAFDLVGERKQTNMQRISDRLQKMSYEIDFRNHKTTDVTITDVEHAYGSWKIVNSSQPYVKKDAKTFEFSVKVPANGEAKVTYDIEYRY